MNNEEFKKFRATGETQDKNRNRKVLGFGCGMLILLLVIGSIILGILVVFVGVNSDYFKGMLKHYRGESSSMNSQLEINDKGIDNWYNEEDINLIKISKTESRNGLSDYELSDLGVYIGESNNKNIFIDMNRFTPKSELIEFTINNNTENVIERGIDFEFKKPETYNNCALRIVHYKDDGNIFYYRPDINIDDNTLSVKLFSNGKIGIVELTRSEFYEQYLDDKAKNTWANNLAPDKDASIVLRDTIIEEFNKDNQSGLGFLFGEAWDVYGPTIIGFDVLEDISRGEYSRATQRALAYKFKNSVVPIDFGENKDHLTDLGLIVDYLSDYDNQIDGYIDSDCAPSFVSNMLSSAVSEVVKRNPVTLAARTVLRESSRRQKNWRNDELERAYIAFRDGSEYQRFGSNNYELDPGDIDMLKSQFMTYSISSRIKSDAVEAYKESNGIPSYVSIDEDLRKKITDSAVDKAIEDMIERRQQEQDIMEIRKDTEIKLNALMEAGLVDPDFNGVTLNPATWYGGTQASQTRKINRLIDQVDSIKESLDFWEKALVLEDDRRGFSIEEIAEYIKELGENPELTLKDLVKRDRDISALKNEKLENTLNITSDGTIKIEIDQTEELINEIMKEQKQELFNDEKKDSENKKEKDLKDKNKEDKKEIMNPYEVKEVYDGYVLSVVEISRGNDYINYSINTSMSSNVNYELNFTNASTMSNINQKGMSATWSLTVANHNSRVVIIMKDDNGLEIGRISTLLPGLDNYEEIYDEVMNRDYGGDYYEWDDDRVPRSQDCHGDCSNPFCENCNVTPDYNSSGDNPFNVDTNTDSQINP